MKRRTILALAALLMAATAALGQTAQQVLDKCAKTVSAPGGITANFSMSSAQYGDAAGTIAIKGEKFHMMSNTTTMWFDGKTLWTYMASNDEVNISRPTQQQLQALNPYNFIHLYKKGYTPTMTTSATEHTVHLTATDPQHKIREAFLTIEKGTYMPKTIKMLVEQKWTTFNISALKQEKLADSRFKFNADAYPDAEIIDLR